MNNKLFNAKMPLYRESMIQTQGVIEKKKEVNCLIALHFADEQDPVYQDLKNLVLSKESWDNGTLVTALHCDSLTELIDVIDGK